MDTNGAGDAFVGGEKTELISLKHFAEKVVFFLCTFVGWYKRFLTCFPNIEIRILLQLESVATS